MKTIFTCMCLLLLGIAPVAAQNGAARKVLLTLQDGEKIVTHESCIELDFTPGKFFLITQLGKEVYTYEGSQRKGPFKSLAQANPRNCDNSSSDDCSIYRSQPEDFSKYLSINEDGTMSLLINGKKYGPFKYVSGLYIRPDQSGFVALAADENLKYSLLTASAAPTPVEGASPVLLVSPSGKSYLVIAKENQGMDPAEMMKIDFSKMTQEEIVKMAKEIEEKQKNAGPPKAYVYVNGKRTGPYPAGQISEENPAFSKSGGDNWYMILEDVLYINGNKVQDLSGDLSSGTCNVWISADGKKFAITNYNKIYFSDGSSYPAPLKLGIETTNGKTSLKWISLENEKSLVLYSREL